jgi:hypothetical protein
VKALLFTAFAHPTSFGACRYRIVRIASSVRTVDADGRLPIAITGTTIKTIG